MQGMWLTQDDVIPVIGPEAEVPLPFRGRRICAHSEAVIMAELTEPVSLRALGHRRAEAIRVAGTDAPTRAVKGRLRLERAKTIETIGVTGANAPAWAVKGRLRIERAETIETIGVTGADAPTWAVKGRRSLDAQKQEKMSTVSGSRSWVFLYSIVFGELERGKEPRVLEKRLDPIMIHS